MNPYAVAAKVRNQYKSARAEAAREARAERDARDAAEFPELAVLKGSDKQVAWAKDIRKIALQKFDTAFSLPNREISDDIRAYTAAKRVELQNQTSAKFWIDNRKERPDGYIDFALDFCGVDIKNRKYQRR